MSTSSVNRIFRCCLVSFALNPWSLLWCVSAMKPEFWRYRHLFGNSTSGFSSLKFLKIISVRVDKRFGELISSCCKSLEELSLTDITGTKSITITTSSVKVLYISFAHGLLPLHISAEKLAHLGLYSIHRTALSYSFPLRSLNILRMWLSIQRNRNPLSNVCFWMSVLQRFVISCFNIVSLNNDATGTA